MVEFRLREVLTAKGITPYRLARMMEVDPAAVYRLLGRAPLRVDLVQLARICKALGVHPGDLLTYSDAAEAPAA